MPAVRNYHSALLFTADGLPAHLRTYAPVQRALVVFAGAECKGNCLLKDDTWLYDLDQHTWRQVVTSKAPGTRFHQSLVLFEGLMYTFGGESFVPKYMYHNSVQALSIVEGAYAGGPPIPTFVVIAVCAGILAALGYLKVLNLSRRRASIKAN